MRPKRPTSSLRSISRLTLGAVFFLLFSAHVALPCLGSAAWLFPTRETPLMCVEHKLFQGSLDTNSLFGSALPAAAEVFATVVAMLVSASAVFLRIKSDAGSTMTPLRAVPYLARGRPFAASTPSFLPAFAARRDG